MVKARGKKAHFSQGPGVTLTRLDARIIRRDGYRDFDFGDINGTLRVRVVKEDFKPGLFCEHGVAVRRFPENISPYDYKGKQLWIIKLSENKFENLITSAKGNRDKYETLMSRCKYDRMDVSYTDY